MLFNLDFPNHYQRRIKAVRVTVPCVTGPYTKVSATLRLARSWTRWTADLEEPLTADGPLHRGGAAVATTSANGDGGVFVLDFDDPRYLPFEGAGVVGSWELELPRTLRPFDYDTIADVVVSISYTARAGDDPAFKEAVEEQLVPSLNDLRATVGEPGVTPQRLVSLRQEFSAEWHRLLYGDGAQPSVTLGLGKEHFPGHLDHLWAPDDTGALVPSPIGLRVTRCTVHFDPAGPLPQDPTACSSTGTTLSPTAPRNCSPSTWTRRPRCRPR